MTETRYDLIDPIIETLRRDSRPLALPLRSVELELGPSQCEFTFAPQVGIAAADAMVLFRSAVKQIARRNGLHASFMCRPRFPNAFSSGWHLHQSLIETKTKANAFASDRDLLSPWGTRSSPGCSRMPVRAPPSRPRRSTATSDIARFSWRPTA